MTKILIPILLAAFTLGGCVAYAPAPPPPHHSGYRDGYRDGDRDRDGVPNRYDRAPNDPYYR